jgi:hypothetical protein
VLPFAFHLNRDKVAAAIEAQGLGAIVVPALLQSAMLALVAVLVGLAAMRRLGLRAPVTAALAEGRLSEGLRLLRSFATESLLAGVLASTLSVGLDLLVFLKLAPAVAAAADVRPPLWKGALASLYGGITEELLLRLFAMSLLALAMRAILRRRETPPPTAILWAANLGAALLFGLAHLPATAALLPLSAVVVVRALVLNGVVGVTCGWLYARRGLEAAMVAHWAADIVVHVITPAVI